MPKASLTSLEGTRTLIGSRHLLRLGGRSILVGRGLFQGLKAPRLTAFPVDMETNVVLLS